MPCVLKRARTSPMPKGPRGEKRPADVIGAARGWGKPAQAVAITGDPDSPVIFHLAMGDGLVPKVIDGEVVGQRAPGEAAGGLLGLRRRG